MLTELTLGEKRDLLRRAYGLEANLPVPLLVQPFAKWYATADVMADAAFDLASQERRLQEQEAVGDFTVPGIKAGVGLGALAASFGAGCEFNEHSDGWVLPLIGDHPERVYDLKLPDPAASGQNPLLFQRIAYFNEHGRYPVQPGNIASPLTTASYIWGYTEFLAALVQHPKEVHHLL